MATPRPNPQTADGQSAITTYRNLRIPLIGSFQNRQTDASKDQRFVNVFPEIIKTESTDGKKVYLNKRAGVTTYSTPSAAATGRGIYVYNSKVYTVWDNILYSDATPIQTINTSTGTVGWVETTGGTKYLMVVDGTDGWLINSVDTVARITDADFPTPHIPIPTYLDGYVFLIKSNSESIYNCDLDAPASWDAANFIDSEMFPDTLVALARLNNQVLAFGTASSQFFYDAANAVQSPLGSNPAPALQIGCACPYAIHQNEKFCVFVGQSKTGGHAVYKIDGFEPKKISIEPIEKLLDAESTSLASAKGYGVRIQGHYFYVLNLVSQSRTLVYDLEDGFWSEWSSNNSGSHIKFNYDYATELTGDMLIQHVSSGAVHKFSTTTYQDNSVDILCLIRTTKLDFDTMANKFFHSIYVVGDINPSSTTMTVRWTNDDYQNWSATRTLTLNTNRAFTSQLGAARRRAFEFSFASNYPLRLEAMELRINTGDF